ncbi:Protein of unknown function, partial [Gryllus bimaculatus]
MRNGSWGLRAPAWLMLRPAGAGGADAVRRLFHRPHTARGGVGCRRVSVPADSLVLAPAWSRGEGGGGAERGRRLEMVEGYRAGAVRMRVWGRWETARGRLHVVHDPVPARGLAVLRRRAAAGFTGMVVLARTLNNPPFTLVKWLGQDTRVRGFIGDVWDALEGSLNFTFYFSYDPRPLFLNTQHDAVRRVVAASSRQSAEKEFAPGGKRNARSDHGEYKPTSRGMRSDSRISCRSTFVRSGLLPNHNRSEK